MSNLKNVVVRRLSWVA